MELYGIAEAGTLFSTAHFEGTRKEPVNVEGDLVKYVFAQHKERGVNNVIWALQFLRRRSFMNLPA